MGVNSKLGGNSGAYLATCILVCVFGARANGKPLSDGYPCTYIPFEPLVCTAISSEKSRQNQQAKLRIPISSLMELSSLMQNARTKKEKKLCPQSHNNRRMP